MFLTFLELDCYFKYNKILKIFVMDTQHSIEQTVVMTGDRIKLKDLVHNRLMECGWRDEVRLLCRNAIKEKGINIKVENLIAEVTPQARALVPDTVKKELLMKIKTILAAQAGLDL